MATAGMSAACLIAAIIRTVSHVGPVDGHLHRVDRPRTHPQRVGIHGSRTSPALLPVMTLHDHDSVRGAVRNVLQAYAAPAHDAIRAGQLSIIILGNRPRLLI